MYLLQLYLVTMETFVVKKNRCSPLSMGYTTLESTLDQYEMEAMCTICTSSGSKILMNRELTALPLSNNYILSTSVKPCFLQSNLGFSSA